MTKLRWKLSAGACGEYLPSDEKVDAFIEEVIEVCKRHELSISHEDGHGTFEIEKYSESNVKWLRQANDGT